MAASTEQQGLELLLFSPKLYAEKNNAENPRVRPRSASHNPSVFAGKDGELLASHSRRFSCMATRRSGSLPLTPMQ
jgi:hypothetical protein